MPAPSLGGLAPPSPSAPPFSTPASPVCLPHTAPHGNGLGCGSQTQTWGSQAKPLTPGGDSVLQAPSPKGSWLSTRKGALCHMGGNSSADPLSLSPQRGCLTLRVPQGLVVGAGEEEQRDPNCLWCWAPAGSCPHPLPPCLPSVNQHTPLRAPLCAQEPTALLAAWLSLTPRRHGQRLLEGQTLPSGELARSSSGQPLSFP